MGSVDAVEEPDPGDSGDENPTSSESIDEIELPPDLLDKARRFVSLGLEMAELRLKLAENNLRITEAQLELAETEIEQLKIENERLRRENDALRSRSTDPSSSAPS